MNIWLFKKRIGDLITEAEVEMTKAMDTKQRIKQAQAFGVVQGLNTALRLANESNREPRRGTKDAPAEEGTP